MSYTESFALLSRSHHVVSGRYPDRQIRWLCLRLARQMFQWRATSELQLPQLPRQKAKRRRLHVCAGQLPYSERWMAAKGCT